MRIHGISRRKLGTDGHGVTDLVAMASCLLSCEYCLNRDILSEAPVRDVTPEWLLSSVMQEACYFVATGGGVAFGGGEPLLQWKEISKFASIRPDWMELTVETALQVEPDAVKELLPVVGFWLVDIKTLDPATYELYAHGRLSVALSNLGILSDVADRVRVRVPTIPGIKRRDVAEQEASEIRAMGFGDTEVFDYVIR